MSKLVLTRKENNNFKDSSIIIHEDGTILLTVTIIKINGKQVKLSLETEDDSISIDRKEIYEKKYGGV